MANDPSGWQVLLVSVIPTHLSARRCSITYHTTFSVSQRTWIPFLRLGIHEFPRRKKARVVPAGCVFFFFRFWLSDNSFSSPVNGYSEGRWPTANVGVYSYIITKASSTLNNILYYVVLKKGVVCPSANQIWILKHLQLLKFFSWNSPNSFLILVFQALELPANIYLVIYVVIYKLGYYRTMLVICFSIGFEICFNSSAFRVIQD